MVLDSRQSSTILSDLKFRTTPARPPQHPRPHRREAHHPSGWDRYLSLLERHRVPENQRQWYMRRVEAFIDAVKPMRMGEVAAEQITAFFLGHAREQRLSDWQFPQMVDAVQLLLIDLTDSAGAREPDWDSWKEAGKELGEEHPTLARDRSPEQSIQASPRYAHSAEHHPVLKSLACTLRARQYAMRCAIPSRPTCWRTATTSAPSRSC